MQNIIKVYRELFRYCPSTKWQIPLRAVLMVVLPLIEGAIPAMAIAMIMEKNIAKYVIGISALLLFDVTARVADNFLGNRFEDYMVRTRVNVFWTKLIEKTTTMDYCNVEPAPMQDTRERGMNALNGDTLGVQGLQNSAFELVCYSFGLLSYGAIVLTIDIRVLIIMAAMSAVGFLLHRHAVNHSDKKYKENARENRAFGRMLWEARVPEYGKDIRIYHVENWFRPRFDEHMKRMRKWNGNVELHWYFPTISDSAFGIARDFLMYSVLILRVLQGSMTVAEFTFYVGVVSGFGSWLTQFLFKLSAVMKTNRETKAYYEFLAIEDSFLHGEGETLDVSAPVSIEFRDVSFAYEGEEILSHLSFRIDRGRKIALVGNNGAGKTTIVKLLCGFYHPTKGEILINGLPIERYDMDNYRQGISAVFQDGFISALTIAMNVAGNEEEKINRARVRECLRQAGLWEKVDSLPDKENSYISQKLEKEGVDFSGGEIQKLLIARALYQAGRLLILDEPTSALDPIAESGIYQKYNEMTEGRTSLFISHRLASTKFCDEIFFLEKGEIAERGTHEELLEKGGKYRAMFDIQSHYYKEVTEE